MKLWGDRALGGRVRISALGWAMGCHPGSDRCSRGAPLKEKICVISGSVLRHGIGALAAVRRRRAFRGGRIHTCTGDHACGNALDAQRAGGSGRYGASSADNVAASAVVYSLPRGVKLRALGATGAAGTLPGGLYHWDSPLPGSRFCWGGRTHPGATRRAPRRNQKKKNTRRRLGASTRHWRITTTRSTTRSTAGPPCAPRRPEGPPPRALRC